MGFAGFLQQRISNLGPWFLQQRYIGTFLEAVGLTLDGAVESLAQGLRLSQPLRGDSSTLPSMSLDRGIRLYSTEPVASQRYRLSQWWNLRRQFGTHQGEMRNVQPLFLPNAPVMRIVHQAGDGSSATWHTLDASGVYTVHKHTPSNWDFDGITWKTIGGVVTNATNTDPIEITTSTVNGVVIGQQVQIAGVLGNTAANGIHFVTAIVSSTRFEIDVAGNGAYTSGGTVAANMWSRWWAIIYTDALGLPAQDEWDGGQLWDGGSLWGGLLTSAQADDIVAGLRDAKSAHSMLWGVILATDPASFDPTATATTDPAGWTTLPVGNWGYVIDNVTGDPTRLPTAVFIYDLQQA